MTETRTDEISAGAGPAGLACAIAATKSGLSALILEKGSIGDAIRRFSTFMTFFSSADLLEIGDIPFRSAGFRPTRSKAVRYLSAAAQHNSLEIRPHTLVKRGRSAEVKFAVEASGRVFQVAPRDHRNRIR